MKVQELLMLGLLMFSETTLAEGGCPAGYTPVNNGQNWTCIPGGNDTPAQQQPQESSLPPQPSGYWEKTWGAIAPSPVGGVLGTAVGASSKEEAERLALVDCKAKGGRACEVNLVYHNQCAAMVVGDKRLKLYGAGTIQEAADLAMSECEKSDANCEVYYSACTEPIFHKF